MSYNIFLNVKLLESAFSLLSDCEIFANLRFQPYTTSMMQIVDTLSGRHMPGLISQAFGDRFIGI